MTCYTHFQHAKTWTYTLNIIMNVTNHDVTNTLSKYHDVTNTLSKYHDVTNTLSMTEYT